MREELELQLQADFPFMARSNRGNQQNTYQSYGCECNNGWYHLIHEMCQAITDRYALENEAIDFIPLQIKEKFATLRVYYRYTDAPCSVAAIDFLCGNGTSIRFDPGSDTQNEAKKKLRHDIAQIVRTYEKMSACVCEYCGKDSSARIRMDMSWKKTLCDDCHQAFLFAQEERRKRRDSLVKVVLTKE